MRIVLIDGSPEGNEAVTHDLIERYLPVIRGNEYGILYCRSENHENDVRILNAADAVVLFSPVYNGGLPDRTLAFLSHLVLEGSVRPLPFVVYLHTDLFDPKTCETALAFVRSWAEKMRWVMKTGVCIGGDRLLFDARSSEMAETLYVRIDHVFAETADIFSRGKQDDMEIHPPLPRFLYHQLAERWMKKANVTK